MIPSHNISLKKYDIPDRNKIALFLSNIFKVQTENIVHIAPVKKGLTNDSFTFSIKGDGKYVIRIPNVDTASLVNREQEATVYKAIRELHISDDVVYLDAITGVKVTKFIESAHNLEVSNQGELSLALDKLKLLHTSNIKVPHTFDLFSMIDKYEGLRGKESFFQQYVVTKANILKLLICINDVDREYCLCHIDANCDNFLITDDKEVRLIDFEYAGMQDPNLDIAMICLYSQLDRNMIDVIIDTYYGERVDDRTRYLIYAYIAIGGFIWSIWCEVKEGSRVLDNKYACSQYEYAKEYFQIVYEEANQIGIFKGLYR